MPKQMVEPTIKELSGVDHPAHLTEGWLMMKGASPEVSLMLARAEAIAKGLDPASVTLPVTPATNRSEMNLTDEQRAAMSPEAQTYVKSLEDAATAAATAAANAVSKSAEDLSAEEFEKSLASLPEPVRKSIAETQRRAADAEKIAKSLYDERETNRFEAMAKELVHLPGVDTVTGTFATTMRKAAESNPAAFDEVFKVLKAADGAIALSDTYGEIGTAVIGSGTAASSIEAIAKGLQDKDPDLSYPEAMVKAAESHPELYAQHRKEV